MAKSLGFIGRDGGRWGALEGFRQESDKIKSDLYPRQIPLLQLEAGLEGAGLEEGGEEPDEGVLGCLVVCGSDRTAVASVAGFSLAASQPQLPSAGPPSLL